MSEILLDASALLALVQDETGAEHVIAEINHAAISTINLTEVVTKLFEGGMSKEAIQKALTPLNLTIVPFDEEMAYEAGHLRLLTRKIGLSVGDRACLATARLRKIPVLTADRVWLKANVGVDVRCIR